MAKSEYIVQFGGLSVGVHDFEFSIKGSFFKNFENTEISEADIFVKASLIKQNNLLQMQFHIKGTVDLDCDRCLKNFHFPIETKENLVIKHGNPSESNDEILVITEGTEEFNVAQYLYEYILVAIPSRRVPCEIDKAKYVCDKELLNKLNALAVEQAKDEEPNNPIWEQLNKIKFNKN